jgi:hypothetical protein
MGLRERLYGAAGDDPAAGVQAAAGDLLCQAQIRIEQARARRLETARALAEAERQLEVYRARFRLFAVAKTEQERKDRLTVTESVLRTAPLAADHVDSPWQTAIWRQVKAEQAAAEAEVEYRNADDWLHSARTLVMTGGV